jgi:Nif-specific regulatory protein
MYTVEPDDLPRVILESTLRLFSAEACSIALIDETERKLVFTFSAGGADVGGIRMELGQGIAGWVAQTGEGVVCNDVLQDPRFFGGIDRKTGFKTRSLLCAPIKQQEQVIGAIEVLNTTQPNGFTNEDLRLLTAFGGLAGTAINRAKAFATTHNANVALQEAVQNRYHFIIGNSPAMQAAVHLARTVAATNSTVLLLGESGTGKEIMARSIHQWSPRAAHPFIAVNCVALTPELMESELFGHEKGSFTGAIAQKKGKFELAHNGTVFLDEIGDLTLNLQTKLLRVLQEREFQRVGGTKDIRTDVRILAATNRDLGDAVQTGAFRKDLYYRLNVVSITLPPLRDHKEDISLLAEYFIDRYCREVKRARLEIDPSAIEFLKSYDWPGNVRELQAVVLCPGPKILESDFTSEIRNRSPGLQETSATIPGLEEPLPMAEALDHFKRALIRKAMERAAGNQAEAAKLLGLQRSNLCRMMKYLGLR